MEHRLLGRTETGRPIEVLTAHVVPHAATPREAAVLLGAHPDEDTAWSGQVLIQRLATAPGPLAGLTVHVVLCADPGGAYLNRRRGGSSLATYFLPGGYHRPATSEQPCLQLPLPGADAPGRRKELAATHALRTLLDEVLGRPDGRPLIIDLHRCLAGGMYAMSTERQGALHSRLARVARAVGLPLELGGEATGARLGPSVSARLFFAAPASNFARLTPQGTDPAARELSLAHIAVGPGRSHATVTEYGPRPLAEKVLAAYEWWRALDTPAKSWPL